MALHYSKTAFFVLLQALADVRWVYICLYRCNYAIFSIMNAKKIRISACCCYIKALLAEILLSPKSLSFPPIQMYALGLLILLAIPSALTSVLNQTAPNHKPQEKKEGKLYRLCGAQFIDAWMACCGQQCSFMDKKELHLKVRIKGKLVYTNDMIMLW